MSNGPLHTFPQRDSKRRIVFVAGQFVPPVDDGSTYVFKSWIDFLAETYDLYAILFASRPGDTGAAEHYLRTHCKAHLILPGPPRSRLWKVARAASRFAGGTLLAPRSIEEFGRQKIHRRVAEFIATHDLDLFLISKLSCIPLFGESNLRRPDVTFLLDIHDDFVLRDAKEREVLLEILRTFPILKTYSYFRHMRLRHALSRLVVRRARAQEDRLYGAFDCLLSSSPAEHATLCARFQGTIPCELLGWPGASWHVPEAPAMAALPPYHAGFIGSDHPFNLEGVIFFCRRILPLVRQRYPDFKFLIAGHVSAPLALAAASWPGVQLVGYLPDARRFYDRVRMIVVPILSGTGISLKTVEALGFAKPVVATGTGARGLDPARHCGLIVADEPESFAAKVLEVLDAADTRHIGSDRPLHDGGRAEFLSAFEHVLARHCSNRDREATISAYDQRRYASRSKWDGHLAS